MTIELELKTKHEDPSLVVGTILINPLIIRSLNSITYTCVCGNSLTTSKEDIDGKAEQRADEDDIWIQHHRKCVA